MSSAPLKIVFDGTVFALAEFAKTSRTGVYVVLKNLVEALSAREDVELLFFVNESMYGIDRLYSLFEKALKSLQLREDPFAVKHWNFDTDKINLFSGFYPLVPGLVSQVRHSQLYQMVHDVGFHACPEFRSVDFEKMRESERWLMSGLNGNTHAFCVSARTRNDLEKYFEIPLTRSSVIYPAVRTDLIKREARTTADIRRALNVPSGAPYVVVLSTLEPRKNLATSLRAFCRVVDEMSDQDIYFVVSGTTGRGDSISLFDALPRSVSSRIVTTGYIDDDLLSPLLSNALCLVYPSLYEGFGLPPLEAMSLGTPAIVSNRGALPEVVGNGGKIVDAHDDKAIAESILSWARNPDERQKWSKCALQRAREFNWEAAASSIIEVMRSRL